MDEINSEMIKKQETLSKIILPRKIAKKTGFIKKTI